MLLNCVNRIGEVNPQLFREIKGRLNVRNVAIAITTSLLGQLLLLLYWYVSLNGYKLQVFATLSAIILFALLVAGSYLLISDLAREERRGTLNFIQLSPQSAHNILIGKMLGVPILLYLNGGSGGL
jgi:hypothetical protein